MLFFNIYDFTCVSYKKEVRKGNCKDSMRLGRAILTKETFYMVVRMTRHSSNATSR